MINWTTSPIRSAACDSAVMRASVDCACCDGGLRDLSGMHDLPADLPTEDVISPVAAATD